MDQGRAFRGRSSVVDGSGKTFSFNSKDPQALVLHFRQHFDSRIVRDQILRYMRRAVSCIFDGRDYGIINLDHCCTPGQLQGVGDIQIVHYTLSSIAWGMSSTTSIAIFFDLKMCNTLLTVSCLNLWLSGSISSSQRGRKEGWPRTMSVARKISAY